VVRILLYTSPGCPDCAALKRRLQQRRPAFEARNPARPSSADEANRRCGLRVAPVGVIGERRFFGTCSERRSALAAALAT